MSFSEQNLAYGSAAHYLDAAWYDHSYRKRRHDVEWYVELARRQGGPVLELGIGSGRIALAMAEAGIEVHGIDASETMLAQLETHAAAKGPDVRARIHAKLGDFRRFTSRRKFGLIIAPFNALMHLYSQDDIARCFGRVLSHLDGPRARFVFDVLVPDTASFSREPTRAYPCGIVRVGPERTRYRMSELFAYDAASQVQIITTQFVGVDRPHDVFVRPLAHRQFFPQELSALLALHGFDVISHDGGFEGEAVEADCESQVIVARRARRRAAR